MWYSVHLLGQILVLSFLTLTIDRYEETKPGICGDQHSNTELTPREALANSREFEMGRRYDNAY